MEFTGGSMYRFVLIFILTLFCLSIFADETAYVPGEIMIQISDNSDMIIENLEADMKAIELTKKGILVDPAGKTNACPESGLVPPSM